MSVSATPAAGALGAFVHGFSMGSLYGLAEVQELRALINEHRVVFLRGQPLDLDALERLTDALGGRDVTPYVKPLDDRPFVIRVVKEADDELNFANAWHTDLSYLEAPPSYTLLQAWDVPPAGGDTLWSNQVRAFATLSSGLKETLRGLRAVHSAGPAYGTGGYLEAVASKSSMAIAPSSQAHATQSHPVVTRHPETGEEVLYINAVYAHRFDGWSHAESAPLMQLLFRHAVQENLTCRLQWAPGTLAIWDNRSTQHNALNDYTGVRREMFRTSVKGSVPIVSKSN
jgi:taurine dioxygenase